MKKTNTLQNQGLKGTISRIGGKVWIIAILVLFTSASAFADDKTAPDFRGSDNFKKTFPHATEVKYVAKEEYTMVTFMWNGLNLQAFYDRQGNAIGTSRQISVSDLPLSHQVNIRKEYPAYDIIEAIEFDNATEGMSYFVTVVSAKKSYVLQVSAEGNISVFKKMKN